MMGRNRKCNCEKATCFTCRRRVVNERYRSTHHDPRSRKWLSPEVSDEEMDRRTLTPRVVAGDA